MKIVFLVSKFINWLIKKESEKLEFLKSLPKNSVGVEIGVWLGDLSQEILEIVQPKKLHLIDPWEFFPQYPHRWYGGGVAKKQADMDKIYRKVKKRFAGQKQVIVHRGKSEEVVQKFANNYFDWIFIDGDHSYEYVKKDLELFYSKVKVGGIIGGDDYWWAPIEGFPIRRAVKEFLGSHRAKLISTRKGIYVIKKEE
ncbi:class I SAM-dependent methyltransferase [Patescibacteria group bacterium]